MELTEIPARVSGFAAKTHVEKIKTFAWYVLTHEERPAFTSADVRRCYDELGMDPPSSVSAFLNNLATRRPKVLLRRDGGFVLEHSTRAAYDAALGARPTTIQVDKLLAGLPDRLPDAVERAFLDEAYACFRAGAFRAAIVMTWNLAFDHLCEHILRGHLNDFNAQLSRAFPKETRVRGRSDFGDLGEAAVLEVCRGASIVTNNVHKILKQKLEMRNITAHPSREVIEQLTAEEFIKNLVENVVLAFPVTQGGDAAA